MNTHLELEHVTCMIVNFDTEVVNVPRLWTTAAPVSAVSSDIKCHAYSCFTACCNRVSIVVWIEAKRSAFNVTWLNRKRKG